VKDDRDHPMREEGNLNRPKKPRAVELERALAAARLAYSMADYRRAIEIASSFESLETSEADTARAWAGLTLCGAWAALGLREIPLALRLLEACHRRGLNDEIVICHVEIIREAIRLREGNTLGILDRLQMLRASIAPTAEHDIFGELGMVAGIAAKWTGDLRVAQTSFEESVAAFRRSNNLTRLSTALINLSLVLRTRGYYEDSRTLLLESRRIQARIRAPFFNLLYSLNLAVLEFSCGNPEASIDAATTALGIAGGIDRAISAARALLTRGRSYILLADYSKAKGDLEQALNICSGRGFAREKALAHEFLGDLARARGDWGTARAEWQAALAIGERIAPRGDVTGEPLRRMAESSLHDDNIAEAMIYGRRAYSVNTSCGDRKERAATLRVLGDIARTRGRFIAARGAYELSVRELRAMGALAELGESERALASLDGSGQSLAAPPESEKASVATSEAIAVTADESTPIDAPTAADPTAEPESTREVVKPAFRLRERGQDFLTRDPVLRRIVERLSVVARSSGGVLLQGETGTGKEILARFVHEASGRKGAFIAVNASAFPEALVESELFGHIRGAFTGAIGDRKGLLEVAHGGTFFLDEIGELPPTMQSKLLRTLEEKAVRRIGAAELRSIDVRFVVATNRDLHEEIAAGRFRTDLYHRFAIHEFEIPPLRRRVPDIPLLARHFLLTSLKEWSKQFGGFDESAEEALCAYPWPGNVRELANEMERVASVVLDGELVAFRHLSGRVRAASGGSAGEGLFEEMALRERTRIEEALEATHGNQSRAGAILGLSRQALRYKILKYRIIVHRERLDRPPKNDPMS
jgi:DNA-binding NtrC family response regulator/tetratricopeptide (TPR) repeat protein